MVANCLFYNNSVASELGDFNVYAYVFEGLEFVDNGRSQVLTWSVLHSKLPLPKQQKSGLNTTAQLKLKFRLLPGQTHVAITPGSS